MRLCVFGPHILLNTRVQQIKHAVLPDPIVRIRRLRAHKRDAHRRAAVAPRDVRVLEPLAVGKVVVALVAGLDDFVELVQIDAERVAKFGSVVLCEFDVELGSSCRYVVDVDAVGRLGYKDCVGKSFFVDVGCRSLVDVAEEHLSGAACVSLYGNTASHLIAIRISGAPWR